MAEIFISAKKKPTLRKFLAGKLLRKEIVLFEAKIKKKRPQIAKKTEFTERQLRFGAKKIIKEPLHFFSSFRKNPKDIIFLDQEPGEQVLLFLRKDFIVNIPWIIKGIILILLPLFMLPASLIFKFNIFILPVHYNLMYILLYYLFVATYNFVNYITWYFSTYLITDTKLIEVSFSDLIIKHVSETKITLIQDVSYDQLGVVRNIFDYGDVLVQTAGTVDIFTFKSIPQPENVVHIIESLIGRERNV